MRIAVFLLGCAAATRPTGDVDLATGEVVEPDLAEPESFDLATKNSPDLAKNGDLASNADLGPAPTSWGSPGTAPTDVSLMWNGNYATGYKVTLAADPSSQIYYTTDGSAPSLSSLHALLPSIDVMATTRIRWFAVNGGTETAHDDTYGVDTALQSRAGYITQDTSFEGMGPVYVATPNQVVNAVTTFRIWYQSGGCSGGMFPCAAQLVYGVDKVEEDCLFAGGAYNFAAAGTQTKAFTVTAPALPGVHEVQVAHIEELSCANAKTQKALSRPTRTRIGILIVR